MVWSVSWNGRKCLRYLTGCASCLFYLTAGGVAAALCHGGVSNLHSVSWTDKTKTSAKTQRRRKTFQRVSSSKEESMSPCLETFFTHYWWNLTCWINQRPQALTVWLCNKHFWWKWLVKTLSWMHVLYFLLLLKVPPCSGLAVFHFDLHVVSPTLTAPCTNIPPSPTLLMLHTNTSHASLILIVQLFIFFNKESYIYIYILYLTLPHHSFSAQWDCLCCLGCGPCGGTGRWPTTIISTWPQPRYPIRMEDRCRGETGGCDETGPKWVLDEDQFGASVRPVLHNLLVCSTPDRSFLLCCSVAPLKPPESVSGPPPHKAVEQSRCVLLALL